PQAVLSHAVAVVAANNPYGARSHQCQEPGQVLVHVLEAEPLGRDGARPIAVAVGAMCAGHVDEHEAVSPAEQRQGGRKVRDLLLEGARIVLAVAGFVEVVLEIEVTPERRGVDLSREPADTPDPYRVVTSGLEALGDVGSVIEEIADVAAAIPLPRGGKRKE